MNKSQRINILGCISSLVASMALFLGALIIIVAVIILVVITNNILFCWGLLIAGILILLGVIYFGGHLTYLDQPVKDQQ